MKEMITKSILLFALILPATTFSAAHQYDNRVNNLPPTTTSITQYDIPPTRQVTPYIAPSCFGTPTINASPNCPHSVWKSFSDQHDGDLTATINDICNNATVITALFQAGKVCSFETFKVDFTPAVYLTVECVTPTDRMGDQNCVNRFKAYEVINDFDKTKSKAVMCDNEFIRKAFGNAGNPCLSTNPLKESYTPNSLIISLAVLFVIWIIGVWASRLRDREIRKNINISLKK